MLEGRGGLEVSADLDDSVELVWGVGEEGAWRLGLAREDGGRREVGLCRFAFLLHQRIDEMEAMYFLGI